MAIDLWIHQRRLLRILDADDTSWPSDIDTYVSAKLGRWEHDVMKRLVIGTVLAIIMLFLLFFKGDRQWLAICASLLIVFILYSMLIGWSNFLDGIWLHDVRRSTRDQAPDISA